MEEQKSQNPQQQNPQNQQAQQQSQEEQITQETIDHFNKICLDATQIMNEYRNQSVALKQEIAGIVSVYQKTSANTTDAVPVERIISITNEYEQGMREANREYQSLADELKHEEQERNQIVFQIKDCFDKLERMEQKIKQKKRKEAEQKQKLEEEKNKQKGSSVEQKVETSKTEQKASEPKQEQSEQ